MGDGPNKPQEEAKCKPGLRWSLIILALGILCLALLPLDSVFEHSGAHRWFYNAVRCICLATAAAGVIVLFLMAGLRGWVPRQGIPAAFGIIFAALAFVMFVLAEESKESKVSRYHARLVACRSDLKQIGLAAIMYSADNSGQMPQDLQVLVDDGYIKDVNVISCPERPIDERLDPKNVDGTGPFYYAAVKKPARGDCSPDLPIAWEKKAWHADNKVNVLYADGSTEFADVTKLRTLANKHAAEYERPAPMPAAAK